MVVLLFFLLWRLDSTLSSSYVIGTSIVLVSVTGFFVIVVSMWLYVLTRLVAPLRDIVFSISDIVFLDSYISNVRDSLEGSRTSLLRADL